MRTISTNPDQSSRKLSVSKPMVRCSRGNQSARPAETGVKMNTVTPVATERQASASESL